MSGPRFHNIGVDAQVGVEECRLHLVLYLAGALEGDQMKYTCRLRRLFKQSYDGVPVTQVDIRGDWGTKLADVKALADVAPWKLAVVLETGDQSARVGLQPDREPGGAVSN